MNHRLRPDYLDPFINVARLICGDEPPTWLAEQLWRWNRWLYRDRRVEEIRLPRKQMRSTLREIENAALLLTEALAPSLVREFLDASRGGPIVDPERLMRALEDLSDRAFQARKVRRLEARPRKSQTRVGVTPYVVRHHDLGDMEARAQGRTRSEKPPGGGGRRGLLPIGRRRKALRRRRAPGCLAASLQKGRRSEGRGLPRRVASPPH